MRSNGSESCNRSKGWLSGLLTLAGGVGVGAGLLYLLDPDKGAKRRKQIMKGASHFADSAREYAGDAYDSLGGTIGSALSSVGQFASDKFGAARDYAGEKLSAMGDYASGATSGARGYARDKYDDALAYAQKKVFGETRAEHRLGVTVCALSSMALGAALMYAFDPKSGRNRRQAVMEKASDMYSHAGDYAHKATDAIKSGYNTVKDKVGSMAGGGGGGGNSGNSAASNPGTALHNQAST
jgi:hypothetical protein